MKKLASFFFAFFFATAVWAVPEKEIIVQLAPDFTPQAFEEAFPEWQHEKVLIQQLAVHLFSWQGESVIQLAAIQNHKQVLEVMRNELIEKRSGVEPNDPRYIAQWAPEHIGMTEVWDISTGGKTANGDDIVVAIIDADFSLTHEDLVDNIWRNPNEIPVNGIDDDNNGYIDDFNGWNFGSNNTEFRAGIHGTAVAGIIGGKGDNGIGISGLNWDVKMMFLMYERSASEILEAYAYIADMRRRYNESGGTEGAFIVALNGSFGLSNVELCPENNIWNEAHNMMGEVGVLTAASAKNDPIDSDVKGDIPSSCPSDYIISVVATDKQDQRFERSAIGKTTLDIGAPGVDILSTQGDMSYDSFDANSAAAPHVAGAIAILYSLETEKLATDALIRPSETALLVRQAILEGVEKLPVLTDLVSTEGRLDVFSAVRQLEGLLDPNRPTPIEFTVFELKPNPVQDELTVTYGTPDQNVVQFRIFDAVGRLLEERTVQPCCFKSTVESFDLQRYAKGVYFLYAIQSGRTDVQSFFVVD